MYDALNLTVESFARQRTRYSQWIICLTDGQSCHDKIVNLNACKQLLRKSEVNLVIIGFQIPAQSVAENCCEELVRSTNIDERMGIYFHSGDQTQLEQAFSDIGDLMSAPVLLT